MDHKTQDLNCEPGRDVHLFEDYHHWEDQIRRTWRDRIEDGQLLELHLVRPQPPLLRPHHAACVVLTQAPNDHLATSLVSIFEDRAYGPLRRVAITTGRQILFEDLIAGLQLRARCTGRTAAHICTGWFDHVPLQFGQPIPGHNGVGIVLQLRSPAPPIPVLDATAVDHQSEQSDDNCLLQQDLVIGKCLTHGQVAQTHGLSSHQCPLTWGVDIPEDTPHASESIQFRFNPNAPSFDPTRPHIRTQSEFVQDLYTWWGYNAFSWEGEARALQV